MEVAQHGDSICTWSENESIMKVAWEWAGAPTWHVVLCNSDQVEHHHPPDQVNGLCHEEVK